MVIIREKRGWGYGGRDDFRFSGLGVGIRMADRPWRDKLPRQAKVSSAYVALLRGINVGGKNKLPMKKLAEIFAKAGCGEVKTYIQSGNVVFTAPASLCDGLEEKVSKQIEKGFGHKPPVVLRSLQQMIDVVRNNPFLQPGVDEKSLCVMFLGKKPTAQEITKLESNRSPGDEY